MAGGITAGKRELVLVCLVEALRSGVRHPAPAGSTARGRRGGFPGDWAALVTLCLQFGAAFDLTRADFNAVRTMTVEEFATSVIDERIAAGTR